MYYQEIKKVALGAEDDVREIRRDVKTIFERIKRDGDKVNVRCSV